MTKYLMREEYLWGKRCCCFKKVKGTEFNGSPFFGFTALKYHDEDLLLNGHHINSL